MSNGGWVKNYRELLDWEWVHDANMVSLFVQLILMANHKPQKFEKTLVERGQVVTGLHSLSKQTGISVQSLRTCINRLKSTSAISVRSTNHYSVITITNYSKYQNKGKKANKQKGDGSNNPSTSQ